MADRSLQEKTTPIKRAAEPSLKEKTPALAAGAFTTVVVSYGLSYLPGAIGTGSTIFGLAFGSVATGTVSTLSEKGIRRSTAKVKDIRDMKRKKGESESEYQTRIIAAVVPREKTVIRWDKFRQKLPWILAFSLLVIALAVGSVTAVQAIAGRHITVVQQVVHTAPRPAPTVTETVPAPVPSVAPTPTLTPTATPTPTPSTTPPATVTPTPTPSASAVPSLTPTPGISPSPSLAPSPAPTPSSPQFPQGG